MASGLAYLSESRHATADTRAVFVGTRAPHRALTRGAVTQVVARASHRAGLGTIFAHRLRHAAATSMLAGGASLEEIAQVLRHRHTLTTAGHADLTLKEQALARTAPLQSTPGRYQPSDIILAFLNSL
jgi:integrase/recombinase XerD